MEASNQEAISELARLAVAPIRTTEELESWLRLNELLNAGQPGPALRGEEIERFTDAITRNFPNDASSSLTLEQRRELVRMVIRFGRFYSGPSRPERVLLYHIQTAVLSTQQDLIMVAGSWAPFLGNPELWETVKQCIGHSKTRTTYNFLVGKEIMGAAAGEEFSAQFRVLRDFLEERQKDSELRSRVRLSVMEGRRPILHYLVVDDRCALIEYVHRLTNPDPTRALLAICACTTGMSEYISFLRSRFDFTASLPWVRLKGDDPEDFLASPGEIDPAQELKARQERGYKALSDFAPGLPAEEREVEYMSYVKGWIWEALQRDIKKTWDERYQRLADKIARYQSEHRKTSRPSSARPFPGVDLPPDFEGR